MEMNKIGESLFNYVCDKSVGLNSKECTLTYRKKEK